MLEPGWRRSSPSGVEWFTNSSESLFFRLWDESQGAAAELTILRTCVLLQLHPRAVMCCRIDNQASGTESGTAYSPPSPTDLIIKVRPEH
jgi:hypothetical protein